MIADGRQAGPDRRTRRARHIVWLAASCLFVAAVAGEACAARPITVAGAASLTDAFEELGRHASGQTRVEFSFAGSQTLRTQLEHGAGFDVIALADSTPMNALARAKLIDAPQELARSRMVLVAPVRTRAVRSIADLGRPGVRVLLAVSAAPAGRYADRVLANIGANRALGENLRRAIEANVVSREADVRAVLAKVALGEADAGIVYATDVEGAKGRVRVVEIPDRLNVDATYWIATVRGNAGPEAAAFVRFALGPEGRAILARHGFRH